jgi:hypothetical protein
MNFNWVIDFLFPKSKIIMQQEKHMVKCMADVTYSDVMEALCTVSSCIEYSNRRDAGRDALAIVYKATETFASKNNSQITDELLWTKCFELATHYYIQKTAEQEVLTNFSVMTDDITQLTHQYFKTIKNGLQEIKRDKI